MLFASNANLSMRPGLQSFKNVLDSIVSNDEKKSEHMQTLLDYLDATKPREVEDEVPIYLPDIMETWSMASQMNNENVMSAVSVVLALLLKIISGDVDLVSYGLGICRTLLQRRQQELIAKNLSADKGKDFIISPTLRLLREAICLDGGALAAPIFRARTNTFKSLARNMGLRYIGEGKEDPKRPSVRTNATRLLLSCLKLLHNEAKRDLLLQRDIVAALMRPLRDDPPFLIYEILDVLKTSVVQDRKLAKDVKIKILNANSLTRIASLYGYSKEPVTLEDGVGSGHLSVEDAAHDILLVACTDFTVGICRSEQGYYPEGIAPDALQPDAESASYVDFGLDSIPWMNKFGNEIPVRNMLLAEFIESLRPWSSTKQSELLLAIFEASPELIARHFIQKKAFAFDPKLSATWIGYAALLYNVVQLPIPPFFGQSNDYAVAPPPTTVVLDNIVPPPMTLKAMTRCLTNKSKLVSFYAIRLLVLALEKLGRCIERLPHHQNLFGRKPLAVLSMIFSRGYQT
jgi:nucleolar pre-ribosomal-associated protein 1